MQAYALKPGRMQMIEMCMKTDSYIVSLINIY